MVGWVHAAAAAEVAARQGGNIVLRYVSLGDGRYAFCALAEKPPDPLPESFSLYHDDSTVH